MIGYVDMRKALRAIDKWAQRSRVMYRLDFGNNASSGQFILEQLTIQRTSGKGSAACQQ